MSEPVEEFEYWKHTWRGTCCRLPKGRSWGVSIWEQITEDEYEDWVWERQHIWTWDHKTAYEELGLELL